MKLSIDDKVLATCSFTKSALMYHVSKDNNLYLPQDIFTMVKKDTRDKENLEVPKNRQAINYLVRGLPTVYKYYPKQGIKMNEKAQDLPMLALFCYKNMIRLDFDMKVLNFKDRDLIFFHDISELIFDCNECESSYIMEEMGITKEHGYPVYRKLMNLFEKEGMIDREKKEGRYNDTIIIPTQRGKDIMNTIVFPYLNYVL